MGDPQAPFSRVLGVLERHQLIGNDGCLRADVQLVSMGDHFDWGAPADRPRATRDAITLLSWLSAHSPEQVIILAGNHDLSRVCELAGFTDDAAFELAYEMAVKAYRAGSPEPARAQAFLQAYPGLPDVECLARDLSCFCVEQQQLVNELLRANRFRLAHAHAGLLLVHAGITADDFALLGQDPADASAAAQSLNSFLDERVERWKGGALNLAPLHQPGSASSDMARGVLFHRPAMPVSGDRQFEGPPRRRYDPRSLPSAFPQAIGHIADKKARELLGTWADETAAGDGPVRALCIDGEQVSYGRGAPPQARLYFLDGGMLHAHPERYELFDLDTRQPLRVQHHKP